ncbi:MAG: hypothetical protein AAGL69_17455 [Pseudomonadota bacterium]
MKSLFRHLFLIGALFVGTAMAQTTEEGTDSETTPSVVQSEATSDAGTSPAESEVTGDTGEVVGPADDTIDEITVQGQRTPFQLEKIMIQARLDFWDVYNSINNIEDYRVVCRREGRAGTNLKGPMRCVPRYFSERMSDLTQEAIITGAPAPSITRVAQLTRNKKAEADRYMIELIETSPTLREKYEDLLEATANFQATQQKEE